MSVKNKDILPAPIVNQLNALGLNLKAARKRRKWSIEKVRTDIKCAKGTLEDAEKGKPTVSLGVYVSLLDLYGFPWDFAALSAPHNDLIGQSLSGERSPVGTSTRISPSDF